MRRTDRERGRSFAYGVLDRCEYAVLAMTGEDETPYCIPLNLVREGNSLYFHAAMQGKKAELLRLHPAVCVTAVCDAAIDEPHFTTRYASAVAFGTARELTDPHEKLRVLRLLCERYTPHHMEAFEQTAARSLASTAVWQIEIKSITGKCNPSV